MLKEKKLKQLNKKLVWVLLTLMLFVWCGNAWSEGIKWKDLGNGWEEMQIETGIKIINNYPKHYNHTDLLFWCGKKIVLQTREMLNARMSYGYYFVDTDKKSANKIKGLYSDSVNCSPDGRYLIFRDKKSKNKIVISLYDITTKETYELYSINISRGSKNFSIYRELFSPNMKYMLGPSYLKDIKLPDSRVVRVIPYFDKKGNIMLEDFFMWGRENGNVFLDPKDGSQIFRELDFKTGESVKNFLVIREGKLLYGCEGISRANKIYCIMEDAKEGYRSVEEYDLSNSYAIDNITRGLNPRTIIDNIGYLEIFLDGAVNSKGIVFGMDGDKVNIYFVDKQGKKSLVKHYKFCEQPNVEGGEIDRAYIPIISYNEETFGIMDYCDPNSVRIFKKIKK